MIKRMLLAVLLATPLLAVAAAPHPYTARYEVRRNGDPLGTATVSLRALANGRYELTSSTVGSEGLAAIAGAAVDERSVLSWSAGQLETVAYSYRQKLAWKTKSRSFQVDAASRRIDSQDKDRHFSPEYRRGVIDRNAITVAIMNDLAAGKSGDLHYLVPDKDELQSHVYRVAAPGRLDTALGEQRVIRVERIRESANGRSTTLWMGQDKNFVPLRIEQKEPDGQSIEMRIVSLR